MNRSGEPIRTGGKTLKEWERRQSSHHRSRSPRREKQQRGISPQPRSGREPDATPRPLSFAVFVGNRPMTEADSIIHDPNVVVEFARQIFPPEVQQSMVGRQDFEVFREGIHGVVKGLHTAAYEIGLRLCAARQDIEQRDECIRS